MPALEGQRILITGANRGIGLALAAECLQRGAQVVATTRNMAQSARLQELDAPSGFLRVLSLDVNDAVSVDALASAVPVVDVLVNNAAVFPEDGNERLEALDLAHFETAFRTNVVGVARVTQALLPALRRGTAPRIINISSGAGSIESKDDSAHYCYATSKAALNMFTRALASELHDVVVVAVSPGWVRTGMGGANAPLAPEESARSLADTIGSLDASKTGLFLSRDGSAGEYAW